MAKAGTNYTASDAAAETGQAPPVRPLTDAEREYLDQRVEDTAAAIKSIKAKIKGAQATLAAAEREHTEAKEARRTAGRAD